MATDAGRLLLVSCPLVSLSLSMSLPLLICLTYVHMQVLCCAVAWCAALPGYLATLLPLPCLLPWLLRWRGIHLI